MSCMASRGTDTVSAARAAFSTLLLLLLPSRACQRRSLLLAPDSLGAGRVRKLCDASALCLLLPIRNTSLLQALCLFYGCRKQPMQIRKGTYHCWSPAADQHLHILHNCHRKLPPSYKTLPATLPFLGGNFAVLAWGDAMQLNIDILQPALLEQVCRHSKAFTVGETAGWHHAPGPCRAGMHARLMHSVSAMRALAGGSGGGPSAFPSSAGDAAEAARAAPYSLQLSGSGDHHAHAKGGGVALYRTQPIYDTRMHGVQDWWSASQGLQLYVPPLAGAVMVRHRELTMHDPTRQHYYS